MSETQTEATQPRQAAAGESSARQPFIQLSGVSKIYQRGPQQVPVLQDVDLEIPRGAFEAIMGPSGSGKTTLLNLISGIDHCTRGRIEVGGMLLTGRSEDALADWRAQHVGFIFQFYNLVQVLTAYRTWSCPCSWHGSRGQSGASGWRRRSSWSGSAIAAITFPGSSPAGKNSAWASRARS